MQVGTGESKLLLFETFWLYFFSLERFLEELALLKISPLTSKLLALEPNKIWMLSSNSIDRYLKMGHFRLWRASKIKPRHIER